MVLPSFRFNTNNNIGFQFWHKAGNLCEKGLGRLHQPPYLTDISFTDCESMSGKVDQVGIETANVLTNLLAHRLNNKRNINRGMPLYVTFTSEEIVGIFS